ARLLASRADVAVVVDRAFHDAYRAGLAPAGGPFDLVVTETPPNGRRFVAPEGGSRVLRIGPDVAPEQAHGEFIGMAMFSADGASTFPRRGRTPRSAWRPAPTSGAGCRSSSCRTRGSACR